MAAATLTTPAQMDRLEAQVDRLGADAVSLAVFGCIGRYGDLVERFDCLDADAAETYLRAIEPLR